MGFWSPGGCSRDSASVAGKCRSNCGPKAWFSNLARYKSCCAVKSVAAAPHAKQLMQSWPTASVQAVQVPAPLARLVLKGRLREIMLLGRWPRPWEGFPSLEQKWSGKEPAALASSASDSKSAEAWKIWHGMRNQMRKFAPGILQQHGEQARQPLENMLVQMESVHCLAHACPLFILPRRLFCL